MMTSIRDADRVWIAGAGARLFVGVVNTGQRLDQRGCGEADMIGNRENVSLQHGVARDAHELSEGPVLVDTQCAIAGIEMAFARDDEPARNGIVVGRDAHALTGPK